jgi:hypothetical protein
MTKKITLEFPEININVKAQLLEKEEPELSKEFWSIIGSPLKHVCQHTLSTGQFFIGRPRPPKEPRKVGSQANPIGRKSPMLSQLKPGMFIYEGLSVYMCYGPHITEPLLSGGSVVAQVYEEDLDKLMEAGKYVWNAQYFTHKVPIMTIYREKE